MNSPEENTQLIRRKALELGFSACGFSRAEPPLKDGEILDNWLKKRHQAGMRWMNNHLEKRKDPRLLVEGAKSVISVILAYYNPQMQKDPTAPVISRYAYGKDYHRVMKKKLTELFLYLRELYPDSGGRVFVDSAPVLEHAFARNAGLGWIGKNSLLLNKEYGSYFFIGEIITTAELETNETEIKDHCGSCRLCVDECPTHAINADRTVNAGKCISYLTIEHREDLPPEYLNSFYNRVFGCDICQDVCPWNRKLEKHHVPEFNPLAELMKMTRKEWVELDESGYKALFEGSAVKRAGFQGLRRNIDFIST